MDTVSLSVDTLKPADALAIDGFVPTAADLAELDAWYAEIDRPLTDAEVDAMYEQHLAEEAAERALAEDQTQSVADAFFRGLCVAYGVNAA
jgi:hypothetical protein